MFTVRDLNRQIKEMAIGDTFYANIINFSDKAVVRFKEMLKEGIITPDRHELVKTIITIDDDFVNLFITGEKIIPQMTYIKIK